MRGLLDIVNYVYFIEEIELFKPEEQRKSFGELINEIAEKLKIHKLENL